MSPIHLSLSSLKNICSAQGTPYHEVCYDDSYGNVLRRRFSDVDVLQIPTPYVCCGLVKDTNVFANTFVHTLENDCVFHGQSIHISPQSVTAYAENFIGSRQDSLFQSFVEEECVFLGGLSVNPDPDRTAGFHFVGNFENFVCEFLVRMAIFELYGLTERLPLVIHDELPETWIDYICMAGGSRQHLIRIPAARTQAYRKVWVASSGRTRDQNGRERLWDAGIHWLRYKVLQSIGGPRLSPRRRIFLRSGDMSTHRLVNEEEIALILAQHGIEAVEISKLPAREQVEIVSGAELIVATADTSGLSWFAPEHCASIILTPKDADTGLWAGAGPAAFLRQPYEQLGCVEVESVSPHKLAALKVDPEALRNLIQTALGVVDCSHTGDAIRI